METRVGATTPIPSVPLVPIIGTLFQQPSNSLNQPTIGVPAEIGTLAGVRSPRNRPAKNAIQASDYCSVIFAIF